MSRIKPATDDTADADFDHRMIGVILAALARHAKIRM
jgi:hypothetical protein